MQLNVRTDLRKDIQNASCKTGFFCPLVKGKRVSEMDWTQSIDRSQLGYNRHSGTQNICYHKAVLKHETRLY